MPLFPARFLLLAALLAGCAEFPQLDAAISPEARRAPFPTLVPLPEVLDRRADARLTGEEAGPLEARAGRLRARGVPPLARESGRIGLRAADLRARAAPLERVDPGDTPARAARLRERARLLRGITVDEDTRKRIAPRLEELGG
jgi:hypothetical protein